MSKYNKLIASVVGSIVAVVISYLASTGLATCETAGAVETCTLLGFTTAQITGGVVAVVSAAFVYFFPANA